MSTIVLFLALGAAMCPVLAKGQAPAMPVDHGAMSTDHSSMNAMPMHHMMASPADVSGLLDRLNTSLAAIEAAKKPADRKARVAEHSALLKELQGKLSAGMTGMNMMEMHAGMMPMKPANMKPGNMTAGCNMGSMDMDGMKMDGKDAGAMDRSKPHAMPADPEK